MQKRAEIDDFDVADFALPQDDYGTGIKDASPEWKVRSSGPMGW